MIRGHITQFSYQDAAQIMATHIIGTMADLAPDAEGNYSAIPPEKVESLFLMAKVLTKTWPARQVFEELAGDDHTA